MKSLMPSGAPAFRVRPSEFDDQDDWDDTGPARRRNSWEDDPFADAEEAEPEYGDFWPEEEDDDA